MAPADRPLVSIIVNNHNYARYLAAAIDSALAQDYAPVDVIVVDDGSTDRSREIIAAYGQAIVSVLKEAGGQASAVNAGFAACRGEVVIFLDADDRLQPWTARRAVAALAASPSAAKIQFRLAVIDAAGVPTGALIPAAGVALPSGDLRQAVLTHPDDLPWAATSGNAFPAWVLRRVMPIPTGPFPRVGADIYLINVTPLFGPVVSLEEVGAQYRAHGANAHHRAALDLDQTRQTIRLSLAAHAEIRRLASTSGESGRVLEKVGADSLTLLAHRLISAKLEPARHPIAGDTPLRLGRTGLITALRRRDRPVRHRLRYAAWFAATAVAPSVFARTLATALFFPGNLGVFRRLRHRDSARG